MTSLPIPTSLAEQPTKSPPAPRSVAFVPLREACCRSGVPMETLARYCRADWSGKGLAALLPPGDGGKPCWHVREDADPRFARAKSPDLLPIDWNHLNERQRATVRRRRELLGQWLDGRADDFERGFSERQSTDAFVERVSCDGGRVSRGTLYRWFKAFQAVGLVGLSDRRQVEGQHNDPQADPFVEELKRLYLKPRGWKMSLCYTMACATAEEKGWSVPFNERQARRVLSAIPKKVAAYHREGPRAYNAKHGRYVVRDYSKLPSNGLWVSDGYTMDVRVTVGGRITRPTLVSWMDVRSRYPVGWRIVARAENADVILAAFRSGVRRHGLPEMVYHDNGEAYDAAVIQGVTKRQRRAGELPAVDVGVFNRLEVGVRHSLPYNAKAKMIERWHRVIKERFCTLFETYTGGTPDEKPFDLEANTAKGKCPTLEEVAASFEAWLIADYTMKRHGGADMDAPPAEVFAANLQRKRTVDDALLRLETCRRELLKVGRNGVTWRGLTYEAPELDNLTGRDVVLVVDDENVNHATILHAAGTRKGAAICRATLLRKLDVVANEEDTRAALAEVRRDARRVREAVPARTRLADDPLERLHRIAAKRAGSVHTPSPDALVPVRPRYDLLVVDEVHKFIGVPDCLHVLADLLKETGVPQLWTATGDLRRYLDRRVGQWSDPFAQIRGRITHKIDLGEVRGSVIRPDDVRQLAGRKFELKLDAAAARELCELAKLDNEGSLRLVENTLNHVRRLAVAGKVATVDVRLVRAAMDRSLTKRTRERARQFAQEPTPAVTPVQEGKRATA